MIEVWACHDSLVAVVQRNVTKRHGGFSGEHDCEHGVAVN